MEPKISYNTNAFQSKEEISFYVCDRMLGELGDQV